MSIKDPDYYLSTYSLDQLCEMGGNEFLNKCFEIESEEPILYSISHSDFTLSKENIAKFQDDKCIKGGFVK